jgi:hypothetical protein
MKRAQRIASAIVWLLWITPVWAQDVHVQPIMAFRAMVTEPGLIQQFLHSQAILVEGKVDSLEVIDATSNGFGENDLLMLFPSKQIFPLMTVEEPLKSIMGGWHYNLTQMTTPSRSSSELRQQARADQNPYTGLLSFVLRGLERYYRGNRVEGTFRRDENSSYIALWNFAPDSFRYREIIDSTVSDTIHQYDLLQIVSHDTTFIADSTLYDVIYVYKTFHDTVYMPTEIPPPSSKSAAHGKKR